METLSQEKAAGALKKIINCFSENDLTAAQNSLVNVGKVRGRKKSLTGLVDMMAEKIGSFKDKNDVIFISHGDCEKDAQAVADEIKKRFGYERFVINHVGPVIGAHSGPGTVAVFFWGDER